VSKTIFNDIQIRQLENNPNVKHVSERSISYEPAFKATAVKENLQGKAPSQIFIEHGFDLEMIGAEKPKSCLKRLRKTFYTFVGKMAFIRIAVEKAVQADLLRRKKQLKAEARIKYLEAEVDFLKKLDELERKAIKKRRS
jgi:transposase